jgi:hypothetical protein
MALEVAVTVNSASLLDVAMRLVKLSRSLSPSSAVLKASSADRKLPSADSSAWYSASCWLMRSCSGETRASR